MAVTKIWAVKTNLKRVQKYASDEKKTEYPERQEEKKISDTQKFSDLHTVVDYAKNASKTEKEYFVGGINCDPKNAYKEFVSVKKAYGKTDGVLAYHGYISFAKGEVTPEEAFKIGMEYAEECWGEDYQVLVTTHLNTEHLHCHIVVNSVSFVDGHKLADNDKNWAYLRHKADDICLKYCKSVEDPYSKEGKKKSKKLQECEDLLNEALQYCAEIEALEEFLRMHNAVLIRKRKYWTIQLGYQKPVRLKTCGIPQETLMERLEENRIKRENNELPEMPPLPMRVSQKQGLKTRKDYVKSKSDWFQRQFRPRYGYLYNPLDRYLIPTREEKERLSRIHQEWVKESSFYMFIRNFSSKEELQTAADSVYQDYQNLNWTDNKEEMRMDRLLFTSILENTGYDVRTQTFTNEEEERNVGSRW